MVVDIFALAILCMLGVTKGEAKTTLEEQSDRRRFVSHHVHRLL